MMDVNNEHHKDLRELIEKALDGTISAEELVRLESTIINDPAQRRYYCEYLHMTIGLMRLCDGSNPPLFPENDTFDYESLWRALLLEEERAPTVPTPLLPEQISDKQPRVKERIPPTRTLWLNVAAVCVVAVFLFLISAHLYQILVPREVATVNKSLRVNKAENHTLSVGTRLTNQKDPIRLNSGVLEILFDGGAQVLLEAPTVFRLTSEKLMVLHTGQLYAMVPDYAQGFTIETPCSRIIDMGTEFGVKVAQDGTSDIHMFKGKAAFIPDIRRRTSRSLTLTAGQAKRVDARSRVQDIQLQDQFFVRYFNTDKNFIWRGQHLSLADLVGQGNGLGNGQVNVYVDPLHGYTESLYTVEQDNDFHELPDNPFIDGLFIPDGRGKQVVSSQAHVFAACPPTNGESYANLGANPYLGVWATDKRTGRVQFNGQSYNDPDHPCLVMHANLGITVDLHALRNLCPDVTIRRFVSQIGIVDFEETVACNADFWVLVDGDVRVARRHVTDKGRLNDISVALTPSDRFLTLATTDGGDVDRLGPYQRSYTCDWCVFVEPALILEKEEGTTKIRMP